jgi:2-polyprenyl-6-methoxyphenol hydroxylase-like FAD-dependent oxidoreductase
VAAQRGSQDSARIYISITTPDENFPTTSGLGVQTAADAKIKLLSDNALFGRWGARAKELVAVGCDEESKDNPGGLLDIRSVYGLPIGHTWESKLGMTLIGDAAHLMPPSGEGVNIAMLDAMLLCEAINKAHEAGAQDAASFQSALNPVIKEFEVSMAVRAKKAAKEAKILNEILFRGDGARAMAEWFKSFEPPE